MRFILGTFDGESLDIGIKREWIALFVWSRVGYFLWPSYHFHFGLFKPAAGSYATIYGPLIPQRGWLTNVTVFSPIHVYRDGKKRYITLTLPTIQ